MFVFVNAAFFSDNDPLLCEFKSLMENIVDFNIIILTQCDINLNAIWCLINRLENDSLLRIVFFSSSSFDDENAHLKF